MSINLIPIGTTPNQPDPPHYLDTPIGIKLHAGKLYVADACNCRIVIVDPGTMTYQGEIVPTRNSTRTQFLLLRVAFDMNGEMWVSDGENSQILKIHPNGGIIARIGCPGTAQGEFQVPNGIAFDQDGNMYVADEWNHRVQKFDSKGNYVCKVDTGPYSFPQDVAVKDDYLYVTWTFADKVAKYDLQTLSLRQTFQLPTRSLPRGVDVAGNGEVVVAATMHNKTIVFNPNGSIKATIATPFNLMNTPESMGMPTGVQIGPRLETIYQVQSTVHVIHKYEYVPRDQVYQLTRYAGHVRNCPSQLSFPCGFSCSQTTSGRKLAIADRHNHRIQVYDNAGNFQRCAYGPSHYSFFQSTDVLYGSDGRIYVCDRLPGVVDGRITVFDSNWTYVTTLDKTTLHGIAGDFFPFRLTMDAQNNLFCVDGATDAIYKINPTTQTVVRMCSISTNVKVLNRGLAIRPDGHVYVIEQNSHQIRHFDNDLRLLGCFGHFALANDPKDPEGMFLPSDLCFSDNGDLLFVADSGNFRIKVFQNDVFVQNLGSIGITSNHFFGVVAIKASGQNQITTCSAYCNKVSHYIY